MCKYLGTLHGQLRLSQLRLLLTIAANPGLTQTKLADILGITVAAVSRSVDVLGTGTGRKDRDSKTKALGWIRSKRDPLDERTVVVELTQTGRDVLEQMEGVLFNG